CLSKLPRNFLLTHILLWTFAFVPCAMVVHVALFFDFGDEGTATIPTRNQSLERPGVLLLPCTTLPVVSEYHFGTVKEILRNEWFVDTPITLPCPDKIAVIDRIGKHGMNATARHLDASTRTESLVIRPLSDVSE